MGGVWLDLSTFLITSLHDLVEKNNCGFTSYYIPVSIGQSWMISQSSQLYDMLSIEKYVNNIVKVVTSDLLPAYKKFSFMPENYFLISTKNHPIVHHVLNQLKVFYTQSLNEMISSQAVCFKNNNLIFSLFTKIFNLKTGVLKHININNSSEKMQNAFACSYLFNYLQLYLAIVEYTKINKGNITYINNSTIKEDLIKKMKSEESLCKSYACNDIKILFKNSKYDINLLSASYSRLGKWSNLMEYRISWEGTIAGKIIMSKNNFKNILKKLHELEIDQFKFSSWSRNSPIIKELIKKVNKQNFF